MQSNQANVVEQPTYIKGRVVEAVVEKYKQTSMLKGKNTKQLTLDFNKRCIRYIGPKDRPDKACVIEFNELSSASVDLSKPGKYKLNLLTPQRRYEFKFLTLDSWIVFTEALRHLFDKKSNAYVFQPGEAYLEIALKYNNKFNTGGEFAPKQEVDDKYSQAKKPVKSTQEEKPVKSETKAVVSIDDKPKEKKGEEVIAKNRETGFEAPQTGNNSQRGSTQKINMKGKSKEKAKDKDSDSESQDSEDNKPRQNEIVKKRKNI